MHYLKPKGFHNIFHPEFFLFFTAVMQYLKPHKGTLTHKFTNSLLLFINRQTNSYSMKQSSLVCLKNMVQQQDCRTQDNTRALFLPPFSHHESISFIFVDFYIFKFLACISSTPFLHKLLPFFILHASVPVFYRSLGICTRSFCSSSK